MTDQYGRPTEPRDPLGSTGMPPAYPPAPAVPAATTTYGETTYDADEPGRKDAAKQEASDVAHHAGQSAGQVKDVAAEKTRETADQARATAQETAGQAKETAQQTVAVAKDQARQLWDQSRGELSQQASGQQTRLASGLRSFSGELTALADGNAQSGLAADLARQAGDYLEKAGRWFEDREPEEVLADVQSYARRHPGTFVAIAAGLGLVAGRFARSLKDAGNEPDTGARHVVTPRSTEIDPLTGARVTTDPYTSETTTVPATTAGTTTEFPAHGTPTSGSTTSTYGTPSYGSGDPLGSDVR